MFIDESGCPGFKFARGSDPVFAIAMVIFQDGLAAELADARVRQLHSELGHKAEFKFAKCRDAVRDGFFAATVRLPFTVRALLVRKERLYSNLLRRDVDSFYNYFVKLLMQHDGGVLIDAKVRLDGSGDREFQRALKTYVRRELPGKVAELRLSDSERDPLVQLADMCVGAIARSARDRPDAGRWRAMLAPRIENVWDFQ